jgi:hypothetical protein
VGTLVTPTKLVAFFFCHGACAAWKRTALQDVVGQGGLGGGAGYVEFLWLHRIVFDAAFLL